LQTTDPGFDGAGTPVWDGSRLHLDVAIDSLLRAGSSRDAEVFAERRTNEGDLKLRGQGCP
jgi:hypothetical protein